MDELPVLPIELLHVIASFDQGAYRALLAIPFFARSLNPSIRTDYMIAFGYSVMITEDFIEWHLNGKRHREDGPAVEWHDGEKWWYRDGDLHRDNGPAIEYADGTKEWYREGERHRENGPAIEYANGTKYWYRNGIFVGYQPF